MWGKCECVSGWDYVKEGCGKGCIMTSGLSKNIWHHVWPVFFLLNLQITWSDIKPHKVSSWEWAVNLVTAYSSEVAFPRVALYSCFHDFHKLICSQQNYQTLKLISSLIIQYLFLILNEVEFWTLSQPWTSGRVVSSSHRHFFQCIRGDWLTRVHYGILTPLI